MQEAADATYTFACSGHPVGTFDLGSSLFPNLVDFS